MERFVARSELARKDPARPAIENYVVQRQEQNVIEIAEPDELGPNKRTVFQVKRCIRLFFREACSFGLAIALEPGTQVLYRKGNAQTGRDNLCRFAVYNLEAAERDRADE